MSVIVKTNPEEFESYLEDASHYRGRAERLLLPESGKEIAEILAEHSAKKIPVTVAGGRTGLTGSSVPEGGSILGTDRLNQIKTIEKDFAIVEPGVTLRALDDALKSKKLFYPPDPGEQKAFLGGTVATNASGPRAFKYGTTRDWIRRLSVLLPSGEFISVKRGEMKADNRGKLRIPLAGRKELVFLIPQSFTSLQKNSAGYYAKPGMDLIDLLIGAEGTLGVVTEIEIGLIQAPEQILALVIFFAEEIHSWSFVHEARLLSRMSAHIDPPQILEARSLEYFDERALDFMRNAYPHIPKGAKAALYAEQEFSGNEKTILDEWFRLTRKYKGLASETWVGTSDEQREEFREFRHALPAMISAWLGEHQQTKIGTDMAVPDGGFRPLVEFEKRALKEANLHFVTFGHIGDNHLHLNILPKNEEEHQKGKALYLKFIREAVRLGGTISAEHGIGKLKKPYLKEMFDEKTIRDMAAVKKAFDPAGVLNRGNLFTDVMMI